MTDEEDEYLIHTMWHAANILDNHNYSHGTDQVLKLTEIMLNHFPMQQHEITAGPARPNEPGSWLYKKQGASEYIAVSVDDSHGEFRYFSQDAQSWVPVAMAQGEWGGRFE